MSSGWAEPGVEWISPGVHRLPLPLPLDALRAVNVYVVESADGLTCIDGGWAIAESRAVFEQSLREIGYGLGDITSFLVTHAHRDHYTQAAAIRAELGRAVVSLGAAERPALEAARSGAGIAAFGGRLKRAGAEEVARLWAGPSAMDESDPRRWASPDHWLAGDAELEVGTRRLVALHTPGHTAGHFVFADLEAGLLFAGDHVLPTITPSVGFEIRPEGSRGSLPLADFLGSLAKVRSLPDLRLLPAHGAADRRTHARVAELIAHHAERLDQCERAVSGGAATANEVARELRWTRRGTHLESLDPYNVGLAILETQLHLELLAAESRVRRRVRDGVDLYSA